MKKSARGAALIITVWLIALASVLALNYSLAVQSDTKITASGLSRAQARAAAEAGFWRAVFELGSSIAEPPWPTNGGTIEVDFGDASIEVTIQDLGGLADLNSTSDEHLEAIVHYALNDHARAAQVTARIIDWRDRDDDPGPDGAEARDYVAANLSYGPKNGPFNTREELQLVLGMSSTEYEAIAPFVTVHSQKRKVNLAVAPNFVVNALSGIESPAAAAATSPARERINRIVAGRARQGRGGRSFEILVRAEVNGVVSQLAAIIKLARGRRNDPGVAILAWRETWPYRIPEEDIEDNAFAG